MRLSRKQIGSCCMAGALTVIVLMTVTESRFVPRMRLVDASKSHQSIPYDRFSQSLISYIPARESTQNGSKPSAGTGHA